MFRSNFRCRSRSLWIVKGIYGALERLMLLSWINWCSLFISRFYKAVSYATTRDSFSTALLSPYITAYDLSMPMLMMLSAEISLWRLLGRLDLNSPINSEPVTLSISRFFACSAILIFCKYSAVESCDTKIMGFLDLGVFYLGVLIADCNTLC